MGIRTTQIYGLNQAAQSLLEGEGDFLVAYEEDVVRRYTDGRVESWRRTGEASAVHSEPYAHFYGMFDDEYPLMRHVLPNGRVLLEQEYASPWASGPCIFLALVEEGAPEWRPADEEAYADYGRRPAAWVRETLWPDREIEESI